MPCQCNTAATVERLAHLIEKLAALIAALAELEDMEDFEEDYPPQCSHGNMQRDSNTRPME